MRLLAAIAASIVCAVPAAQAAALSWSAPAECDSEAAVREQVERLIGRELSTVEGISFRFEIRQLETGTWTLSLKLHRDLIRMVLDAALEDSWSLVGTLLPHADGTFELLAVDLDEQTGFRLIQK